jgi:hypothetical protein
MKAKARGRMIKAGTKSTLMPGFPLDGIGKHLIYHRFAFTEMDSHLWSASGASAMA